MSVGAEGGGISYDTKIEGSTWQHKEKGKSILQRRKKACAKALRCSQKLRNTGMTIVYERGKVTGEAHEKYRNLVYPVHSV